MNVTRRHFFGTAAGAGLFTIAPAHVLFGAEAPSNQLTRAIIGCGGIAHSENHLPFTGSRLVALCDVDAKHLSSFADAAKGQWGALRCVHDFRDILAMKDVDIVHICTPPHWHGVMSVMAAEAGKDIWCEKPMTRTIGEGLRVKAAIAENKRIFRLNTWFRFKDVFYGFGDTVKPLKKAMDAKLLGWPITATVGIHQGFSWKFYWSGRVDLKPEPVPPELDYDFWLGPAPYKPYNKDRVHGKFRGFWDYDNGGLGDMGQHYLDPVQYILGKDEESPVRIEVDAPPQHPDVVGSFRRLTAIYADGCRIVLDGDESLKTEPFLQGPKGSIRSKLASDIPNLAKTVADLPDPAPQNTDFMECVRTRKPFALNERNGFRSATLVNLFAVAMRAGRNLDFDPATMRAPYDALANRYIYQSARAPWARYI